MAYSNECPNCGANLDPNEQCDCVKNTEEREVIDNDRCDKDRLLCVRQ